MHEPRFLDAQRFGLIVEGLDGVRQYQVAGYVYYTRYVARRKRWMHLSIEAFQLVIEHPCDMTDARTGI